MKQIMSLLMAVVSLVAKGQQEGRVVHETSLEPLQGVTIMKSDSSIVAVTNAAGRFTVPDPNESLLFTAIGFESQTIILKERKEAIVYMRPLINEMEAVVITGTMRQVSRSESPVAVEVYSPAFFKKNPVPSIFEAMHQVNGVRPQLNCNVCNTGDIHINGLEGPYTMVTIDGMPIVSSLASVYGLFGIPSQLIEQVEIVKGPASGLYGSEAIGGLINIITKSPEKSPRFSADLMSTGWLEHSADLGFRWKAGKSMQGLTGINYFNYQKPFDHDHDGFTDITLQHRISVFQKLSWKRRENRTATLAARFFTEERWGGQMNWTRDFRGSDSIYGESIDTRRWELIGKYRLPLRADISFSGSATGHRQRSWYGKTSFNANQDILFGQLIWQHDAGVKHHFLAGATARYSIYEDNTPATHDAVRGVSIPEKVFLPGIFLQHEWQTHPGSLLLSGLRYDHHPVHGSIWTPRLAWKQNLKGANVLRINAGTGFRVVHVFTEDHAALTGARTVEIEGELDPETSLNLNLNLYLNLTQHRRPGAFSAILDFSAWYSYFENQIIPDYTTDPDKIIYRNLTGYAVSRGISANAELSINSRLRAIAGLTFQDVKRIEQNESGEKTASRPLLTENWSGAWTISWSFPGSAIRLDYTGKVYGSMLLPLASQWDPRPGKSPVWSLQNLQASKKFSENLELYGGVKNLLNWTPVKNVPFLIARAHDPFDKKVSYDADGTILRTNENPYGLSFDPAYVYAPNQGRRVFLGLRVTL